MITRTTLSGVARGLFLVGVGWGLFAWTCQPAGVKAQTAGIGIDSETNLSDQRDLLRPLDGRATWVRLRWLAEPASEKDPGAKVLEQRQALLQLRSRGWRVCALIMIQGVGNWNDSRRQYLPVDLTSAYKRGFQLGRAYRGLVDAWEVENEPDLGFVPELSENYAAYLKAMKLGLNAGERASDAPGPPALVLIAPLGLPPGPWLDRFAANDGFGYIDGFNYHYYGYSEDFTDVYLQHEAAVDELSRQSASGRRTKKVLPVFLTEIGYGMLGKAARDTKEGRLRQWRWFRAIGQQASALDLEAPMAFLLEPNLERGLVEFGLTMPAKETPEAKDAGPREQVSVGHWTAGGVTYSAADFESSDSRTKSSASRTWMEMIGAKIGINEATPALAWWLAAKRDVPPAWHMRGLYHGRSTSRGWSIDAPAPSPVVIDFKGGSGLQPVKRYNGHFVTGEKVEPRQEAAPTTPKPRTSPSISAAPVRNEELMVHVRTQNGNLYEVYPTRLAGPDWQHYMEPGDNFTMSFYGRARLPWRFSENKPTSLVLVLYPKQLPAILEIRRAQLLHLGGVKGLNTSNRHSGAGPVSPAAKSGRFGRGEIILYNFSEESLSGELVLPACFVPEGTGGSSSISIAAGERKVVAVSIQVPADRYERIPAEVVFQPHNRSIPPSRFRSDFIPDIGGLKPTVIAPLIRIGSQSLTDGNRALISTRARTSQEAAKVMNESLGWLIQDGASVEATADGFRVVVTRLPAGEGQRVELEIPWPDGLSLGSEEFLSLDFRLGK